MGKMNYEYAQMFLLNTVVEIVDSSCIHSRGIFDGFNHGGFKFSKDIPSEEFEFPFIVSVKPHGEHKLMQIPVRNITPVGHTCIVCGNPLINGMCDLYNTEIKIMRSLMEKQGA